MLPELERIIRAAGDLAILERGRLDWSLKPDGSIVTNADHMVEEFLRIELPKLVPGTGVWGEEEGIEVAGDNGLWLVDPVDGTSNFTFGSPLWGTTAALIQDGELVLGAVNLPDLDEVVLSARGHGVTRNGQRLEPIAPGPVEKHQLVSCCDGTARLLGHNLPGKQRCGGAFVVDATFVAGQRLRGMICGGEKLYDAAACILFGQELGADIRYADGEPLDLAERARGGKFAKPWIIFPAESGYFFPPKGT